MIEFLNVRFSDGKYYSIPADIIALARAEYILKHDAEANKDDEFNYALQDEQELIDWAFGNMDWAQVKNHAQLVGQTMPTADYEDEWSTGECYDGVDES